MKYLLDTHALIWSLEANPQLSIKAQEIIENNHNTIYVSIVSLWEIAIKISIGKLQLSQSLDVVIKLLAQHNIEILTVQSEHILTVLNLPFEHRDPFDRLLIAQALTEKMKFISNEALFLRYGVNRIW